MPRAPPRGRCSSARRVLYGKPEPGPQERLAFSDVDFYVDEIRCPTLVGELAAALLELARLDVSGPLHVAAPDAVSRYELARRLRAAHGLDPDTVRGAPSPSGAGGRGTSRSTPPRAAGLLADAAPRPARSHGIAAALLSC